LTSIAFIFSTMKVNVDRQLFGYQPSSKYLIMCSAAEINSYNLRGSKWWQYFYFWAKFPIKKVPYNLLDGHMVATWEFQYS